ncbi:DUF2760 domain-containing protein [Burkholderia gladioli]|uniref:DUF2760 domain-containing protein n=1 Tax=Burkholderia gladioli TaxID=28095 RepID=UPI003F7AF244
MDLVLIRHPVPAVEAGICYGASDLPLAGEAAVEAAAIAERLRAAQVDWPKAILASPLQRCASVAQAIGVLAARPVRLDARLREIDFGTWEMRRWDEIGAAARLVHEGCRATLREHFTIRPVRGEAEGARVTLPAGFDATANRVTGNVVGAAPFTGTLSHRGWRAEEVKLPKLVATHDVTVIAPAEVEL